MTFEQLLDKLWFFDAEVFAHDSLFVFIKYTTKEEKVFHNCPADYLVQWIQDVQPILSGYNCNNYDKHILRGWLTGMSPEELKEVNDYIIGGGNGWDVEMPFVQLPIMWDLFNEINPRKSLKEIEGNLRLDITETTIPFDLPTKWTNSQYEEVLYYCRHDVQALIPLFEKLIVGYKSKFIISKLGKMDPAKALAMTNANLTAALLKGKMKKHDDNFSYVFPSVVDVDKIPVDFLTYIDDMVEHNDLNYKPEAPLLDLDSINFQTGVGGGHGFLKDGIIDYERSDFNDIDFKCE